MMLVSSTAAQRVLATLEGELKGFARKPYADKYLRERGLGPYRQWVQDRLAMSDLATRLPQGIDAFPDIVESLPGLLRPFERLMRPRTIQATTQHLARNLEWYLAGGGSMKTPGHMALILGLTLLMFLAFVLLCMFRGLTGFNVYGALGGWMVIGFSTIASAIGKGGLCGVNPKSERYLINVMELHRHLTAAYADSFVPLAAIDSLQNSDLDMEAQSPDSIEATSAELQQ